MSYVEPLFDRNGAVSAFLIDDRRIITPAGRDVAWIRGSSIYDYAGRHLAWWEKDHIRDPRGAVMLWKRGATTGLLNPIPQIPPLPPLIPLEPIRPIPQIPPLKPMRILEWSKSVLF